MGRPVHLLGTYDLSFYLWAAVFYLVIVESLRRVTNWLEVRLTRHLKPTTTGSYAPWATTVRLRPRC